MDYFHEALRYYGPLQQVRDYADVPYLFELASCYRAVDLRTEAEDCYKQILDHDGGNYGARIQLAELSRTSGLTKQGFVADHQGSAILQHKSRKLMGEKDAKSFRKADSLQSLNTPILLAPRPMQKVGKQLAVEIEQAQEDIYSLFLHCQSLAEKAQGGDKNSTNELMSATKSLLQNFRNNRVFYPFDKHHRFYGYSKEARAMASRPKHELDLLVERSGSIFGTYL